MSIIRQDCLFSMQELYEMAPTQKYEAIMSAIDLDAIYRDITKKSRFGAPEELNYAAMIISLFVRYIERIPTIKHLVQRLNDNCYSRSPFSQSVLTLTYLGILI